MVESEPKSSLVLGTVSKHGLHQPIAQTRWEVPFNRTSLEYWTADSWRVKPVPQEIVYSNPAALEEVCSHLRQLPPLVHPHQIERARRHLYDVAKWKAFIVQGGNCAESFHDVRHDIIRSKVGLLADQGRTLSVALGKPVIQIARITGQYAKPRSNPFEVLKTGQTVHAFRGHNVNSEHPDDREPDPRRLLMGYFYAAATLNTIGQLEKDSSRGGVYSKPATPLYTSHEVLHLPYESALTQGEYNASATFLWIGERTRQLNGAQVEYARGLRNPIGVKVGPTATPAVIVALLDILSPNRDQYGKVTLITRFGRGKVHSILPQLIRAVQLSGHVPVWICDPCHGNTTLTADGRKTRKLNDMLSALEETFIAHRRLGSHLGGIHLEQTGEEVTECLDKTYVADEENLKLCYRSLCDPRLSRSQAICLVEQFSAFVQNYQLESQI